MPSSTAPAEVRAFVGRAIARPAAAAACIRLAASELVSDLVRRGGTSNPLRVTVTRDGEGVRVDVETAMPGWRSSLADRARRVLTGVCDRWGIDPSGSGSLGWFEVATTPTSDEGEGLGSS